MKALAVNKVRFEALNSCFGSYWDFKGLNKLPKPILKVKKAMELANSIRTR